MSNRSYEEALSKLYKPTGRNVFDEINRDNKMRDERYKEVIFKLNELIRHLLIDSDDVEVENKKYWIDYWNRIESENQDIIDELYNV